MSKERFAYIDRAKAYLIFLVILGHVMIVMNPGYEKLYMVCIQEFIYIFHMAAFYVIHGIIFNNKKWQSIPTSQFIIKRAYSLLIPYLFFEMSGIVWRAIFQQQTLLMGFYNMVTIRCNVGADWFLPAMFVGNILFWIYIKHPNHIYGIVSIILSFVIPMFISENQFLTVIGRGLMAYGFIMIGHMGKKLFTSEKCKNFVWIATSLIITSIVAIIGIKFGSNDFYTCTVCNPITLVVGGVSGTILMLGISQILKGKWISIIGQHTLTIMGTHQLVIYAMSALVPSVYGSISKGILLFVIIIIFEIPVVYLIDRFLPFFAGRK
ncbi:MAG: acyltransferase family protein [Clostridia bacterium]|nr:acyltransferase family protein [Clostridia bacterium]